MPALWRKNHDRERGGQCVVGRIPFPTSVEVTLRLLPSLKCDKVSKQARTFLGIRVGRPGRSFKQKGNLWCREGESNPQGTKYRRILSPLRLPVPPSRPV